MTDDNTVRIDLPEPWRRLLTEINGLRTYEPGGQWVKVPNCNTCRLPIPFCLCPVKLWVGFADDLPEVVIPALGPYPTTAPMVPCDIKAPTPMRCEGYDPPQRPMPRGWLAAASRCDFLAVPGEWYCQRHHVDLPRLTWRKVAFDGNDLPAGDA